MKTLLLPALLLTACTTTPTPDMTGDQPSTDPGAGNNETWATLEANFYAEPYACAGNSVVLRGHLEYSDGSLPENIICKFEFADGTTSNGCYVVRPFPEAQKVVLIASDADTGGSARYEAVVAEGPRSFDASLDVATNGFSISWNADAIYGGSAGAAGTLVSIEPAANVVVDDPSIFTQPSGSVMVTGAGTYTVTVAASIELSDTMSCDAGLTKTVVIADAGGEGGGSGSGSGGEGGGSGSGCGH